MRFRFSRIIKSRWWIPAGLGSALLVSFSVHGRTTDPHIQDAATLAATHTPTPSPSPTPTPTPTHQAPAAPAPPPAPPGLDSPRLKEIALELVASAENSTLNWRAQYGYIEDIHDGRGLTGGIIGFTSGTGDMLELVRNYTATAPSNPLAPFLPALANKSDLDQSYIDAWHQAAGDPRFQRAQDALRDSWYFNPAVGQAKADGLHALGQFMYFDAIINHGPGDEPESFGGIRAAAIASAKPPSRGGNETAFLQAFIRARLHIMASGDFGPTDRIATEQQPFLTAGNLNLQTPLRWTVYGDPYFIP